MREFIKVCTVLTRTRQYHYERAGFFITEFNKARPIIDGRLFDIGTSSPDYLEFCQRMCMSHTAAMHEVEAMIVKVAEETKFE